MLQICDLIFEGCNQKLITAIMTVDQSAAFNCLNHQILLQKLKLYNFSESSLKWISNYLSYRSQYVNIGTQNSSYWSVEHGVPQGSVLGPILYILYVNELSAMIKDDLLCKHPSHNPTENVLGENCPICGLIPTYADDSSYLISSSSRYTIQEKITNNSIKIKNFLTDNQLSINMSKTELTEVMVRQKRM